MFGVESKALCSANSYMILFLSSLNLLSVLPITVERLLAVFIPFTSVHTVLLTTVHCALLIKALDIIIYIISCGGLPYVFTV